MELKHLRTFVAASETQSFTGAARTLGVTQAAVSQHVAALERQCDTRLFHRQPRSVSLTESGKRLYAYAVRILELVDEASCAIRNTVPAVSGRLSIAASTVLAEHVLPRLLAKFSEQFPDVRESMVVSDSRDAIRAVERGDADVGFVGKRDDSSTLRFRAIAEDEMILVVSPRHAWASKSFVTPKTVLKQPLLLREEGSASRYCVEQAFSRKGLALNNMKIVMEVNSNDAIRAAVIQNAGVAFLSSLTASNDLEQGRIVRVAVRGFRTARQLFMVQDRTRALSRAATEFIRFVAE
jgi:DNA-binding transcriptional LysR family regulator